MQFNPRNQTYYNDDNEPIADDAVTNWVTRGQQALRTKIIDSFTAVKDREDAELLTPFLNNTARDLKSEHTKAFILGAGGRNNLESTDYLRLDRELQFQYSKLTRLVKQYSSGLISDKQTETRLELFATSTTASYESGRLLSHTKAGYRFEKRIRTKTESCAPCILYASRGWVTIGTLPAPTKSCDCITNCGCKKLYAREINRDSYSFLADYSPSNPLSSWGLRTRSEFEAG